MRWFCLIGLSGWLLAAGCSGGNPGGQTVTDAASDGATTTALTCQEVRVRIFHNCPGEVDKGCVDGLLAMATPAAEKAFRALATCTVPFCSTRADTDYCHCEQRCFGDGNCVAEAEACAAGAPDEVCDELCH
jgi:hypothetical protein